jgi:hypothetical protein
VSSAGAVGALPLSSGTLGPKSHLNDRQHALATHMQSLRGPSCTTFNVATCLWVQ